MSRHGGDAVVENDNRNVGIVVDDVAQACHAGMEESRVADDADDGLFLARFCDSVSD